MIGTVAQRREERVAGDRRHRVGAGSHATASAGSRSMRSPARSASASRRSTRTSTRRTRCTTRCSPTATASCSSGSTRVKLPRDPRAAVKTLHAGVRRLRGRGRRPLRSCCSSARSRTSSRRPSRTRTREEVLGRAVDAAARGRASKPGRRRLLRRDGRRPRRRADQQRPRRQPLDPPPEPSHRHVPRRGRTKEKRR